MASISIGPLAAPPRYMYIASDGLPFERIACRAPCLSSSLAQFHLDTTIFCLKTLALRAHRSLRRTTSQAGPDHPIQKDEAKG